MFFRDKSANSNKNILSCNAWGSLFQNYSINSLKHLAFQFCYFKKKIFIFLLSKVYDSMNRNNYRFSTVNYENIIGIFRRLNYYSRIKQLNVIVELLIIFFFNVRSNSKKKIK